MLDWLKTLIGMTDIQNRVGLSEKEVRLLKKDFSKLDKKASGISERLLRYLLDDEDEEVLQKLSGIQEAGSTLDLNCNNQYFTSTLLGGTPPRTKFFETTTCQDAPFWYRLAQVYDIASQTEPRHLYCDNLKQQGLEWLEVFLGEAAQYQLNVWPRKTEIRPTFNAALLENMVVLAGQNADAFVQGVLFVDPTSRGYLLYKEVFLALAGLGESFTRHPGTVLKALNQSHHKAKVYVLEMLIKCKVILEPFIEKITELAVCSSKTVRTAAEPLLLSDAQTSRPALEKKALEGISEERYHAVKLLWKVAGETCREFLEQRDQEDKSKKVKKEIQRILSFEAPAVQTVESASEPSAPSSVSFDLAPVEAVDPHAPLPPETKQALHETVQKHNEQAKKYWERIPAQYRQGWRKSQQTISPKAVEKAFEALQNLVIANRSKFNQPKAWLQPVCWDDKAFKPFTEFAVRPELQLIHVIRFLVLMGMITLEKTQWQQSQISFWADQIIATYRQERHPRLDLRTLAAVFKAIGLDEHIISTHMLMRSRWNPGFEWEDEAIWSFFAERLHLLQEAFDLQPQADYPLRYWRSDIRKNAFAILKAFPQVPEQFAPMLWEIALGTGKSERYDAQACLTTYPEKEKRIIAALADGRKDVRAVAAEWLGNLQYREAISDIKNALEKEKYEEPKGIMMQALEKLGVPIEEFVDRKRLAEEAQKGLKKGIPKGLSWFPFDRLPTVHWEKSDTKVTPDILHWFLVQSFKMKNPEPGPLLRLYCSYFRKDERETLGKYILESWIAEDTKPKYTHEEATQLADKDVQQMRGYVQQYPQYYPNWDEQKHFATMLNHYLSACKGSAIPSKGILAVTGACAGVDIVPIVDRYLRDWYGKRAAQCKALVQMLAWIDHQLAIQLLLSIGSRFRTKSIQQEAAQQVERLAERKGWSADALADRTIPTAGFDEQGKMELDYGLRKFSVTLAEDFRIILTDEDGKQIKSLPAARKAEDPEIVKRARKQLSTSRKELKTVLKMQKERLYESMCTQRTWHAEDWELYLNQHPIVGRYCQTLVWLAYDGDNLVTSFRPLPDHSLTDHQDEEVTLAEHYIIRLAHDCYLPEKERNAWIEHLRDYEVVPLFPQFGRTPFTLSEEKKKETEISDFQGHLVSAFALRGKATKLGYIRGEAEDAGWFYVYKKNFLGLELQAVIEFTGNFLPEEDRTVALHHLYFYRQPKEQGAIYSRYSSKIPLGQIPPVLLAECWNDIRAIAAEGTGHDPEWEKKTEY